MIDRIAKKLKRNVFDVPVGFKWFVNGLLDGSLAFVGEESAGAAFVRTDGSVWTTDKDGITPGLLAAEMLAKTGKDPGSIYQDLTQEFGVSYFKRIDAPASREQKAILKNLSPESISIKKLAGEIIQSVQTTAEGNGAPIGGVKVSSQNGWFAARPSGTEDIYKIYAESFVDQTHLEQILQEAQAIISNAYTRGAVVK
jgi:phosphoglucomutase